MAKAKPQPGVWGIDVGQCALKAIRLETIDGQVTATAFAWKSLVSSRIHSR